MTGSDTDREGTNCPKCGNPWMMHPPGFVDCPPIPYLPDTDRQGDTERDSEGSGEGT